MLLLCLPASQLCCKVFAACVKVVPCNSSRGMGEAFGEVSGLLCGFLQEAVLYLQPGIGRTWKEKNKQQNQSYCQAGQLVVFIQTCLPTVVFASLAHVHFSSSSLLLRTLWGHEFPSLFLWLVTCPAAGSAQAQCPRAAAPWQMCHS